MNEESLKLIEEITNKLLNILHAEGFVVAPDDGKRIGFVLKFFIEDNSLSLQDRKVRDHLAGLLGPIFCSTPVQQSNFPSLFERAYGLSKPVDPQSLKDPQNIRVDERLKKRDRRKTRKQLIVVALLVMIITTVFFAYRHYNSIQNERRQRFDRVYDTIEVSQDTSYLSAKKLVRMGERPVTFGPDILKLSTVVVILGVLIGVLLYAAFYEKSKAQHSSKAPFSLTLPIRQHDIEGSPDFDDWVRQLQQREEGNHHILDISSSIRSTIYRGGFPNVIFKRSRRPPNYLMLIDSRSPFDQKTRLYSQISLMLYQRGIDVKLFYFNTTPDYCWNNSSPQGIKTEMLRQFFSESYLLIFTDGIRLIDYQEAEVADWVTKLFGGWSKRAILTPTPSNQWGFLEKVLGTFFIVLPATPSGQFLLRTIMDSESRPFEFQENHFKKDFTFLPSILDNELEGISVDDIVTYLIAECKSERIAPAFHKMIICWAMATGVYDRPSFEMTIAIGKALEYKRKTYGLVTTTHLLLITSLPWLRREIIPSILRDRLLHWLREHDKISPNNESIEQIARDAVIHTLTDTKTEDGSRADEERKIKLLEQTLYLKSASHSRMKTIKDLRPFQRAGLVLDEQVSRQVKNHFQFWKAITAVAFSVILISLLLSINFTVIEPETKVEAFFLKQSRTPDSVAIYNNKAVTIANDRKPWFRPSITNAPNYYDSACVNLMKAWRLSKRSLVYKNAARMYYNQLIADLTTENFTTKNKLLPEVALIMDPLHSVRPGWVPTRSELTGFLNYLMDFEKNDIRNADRPSRDSKWESLLQPVKRDMLKSAAIEISMGKVAISTFTFEIPNNLADSLRSFIIDFTIDKIYLYYNRRSSGRTTVLSTNPRLVEAGFERTLSNNLNDLLKVIPFNSTIEDVIEFEFGSKQRNAVPYDSLAQATECKNAVVRYYWRYLGETQAKDRIVAYLNNNGFANNDFTQDSYLLYIFSNRRLLRIELRLLSSNEKFYEKLMNSLAGTTSFPQKQYMAIVDKTYYIASTEITEGWNQTHLIISEKEGHDLRCANWWVK